MEGRSYLHTHNTSQKAWASGSGSSGAGLGTKHEGRGPSEGQSSQQISMRGSSEVLTPQTFPHPGNLGDTTQASEKAPGGSHGICPSWPCAAGCESGLGMPRLQLVQRVCLRLTSNLPHPKGAREGYGQLSTDLDAGGSSPGQSLTSMGI